MSLFHNEVQSNSEMADCYVLNKLGSFSVAHSGHFPNSGR